MDIPSSGVYRRRNVFCRCATFLQQTSAAVHSLRENLSQFYFRHRTSTDCVMRQRIGVIVGGVTSTRKHRIERITFAAEINAANTHTA